MTIQSAANGKWHQNDLAASVVVVRPDVEIHRHVHRRHISRVRPPNCLDPMNDRLAQRRGIAHLHLVKMPRGPGIAADLGAVFVAALSLTTLPVAASS